ncbi:gamma-glutamylcyclotransferase [Streptomyces albus]|uniref:gamma-glutamylcyclotransferase family protein n=1 Tax=Streptomyces albus TaxID=1888 RepID=UPI0024ACA517|nr:gamma-glutamylcyclotransferase family protein [Streptomyces albus]MDI6407979.1 gamma-glutamylcyclotransferase [Streptomyces albus]
MTAPHSTPADRLAPVDTAADALFVYGTLRFRRILTALLGHVPPGTPATADGWRTAALRGRPYPGLVAAPGATAHGLVLTGLGPRTWQILDAFEDDAYVLRPLTVEPAPAHRGRTWAYLWDDPAQVCPGDWEADVFAGELLDAYATRLETAARIRRGRR